MIDRKDPLPTIPAGLIAAILDDESPEMNEALVDLVILDAAQGGILQARARAHNLSKQPSWLDQVARIIDREMTVASARVKALRKNDVA